MVSEASAGVSTTNGQLMTRASKGAVADGWRLSDPDLGVLLGVVWTTGSASAYYGCFLHPRTLRLRLVARAKRYEFCWGDLPSEASTEELPWRFDDGGVTF